MARVSAYDLASQCVLSASDAQFDSLDGNGIGDDGAKALAEALQGNTALTHLE
jgi:hypothetical protein